MITAARTESSPKTRASIPSQKRAGLLSVQKEKEVKEELSVVQYPLLKYPGIRKIIESLTKSQRKIILFLIDPQNQNQSFTQQQIGLSLGYSSPLSMIQTPYLPYLVTKGYVLKEGLKYKQNFSSMI